MSKSNNSIQDFLMAKLEKFQKWIIKNAKIVMPIVLILCVAVTIVISLNANRREVEAQVQQIIQDQQETDSAAIGGDNILDNAAGTMIAVPEVPLEQNAYPEIDELINSYYKALADADIDTIKTLVDRIDNTEILRIEEMSKYIESYPSLDIYTKIGPSENTLLVYVSTETKFYGYDEPVPGMRIYYVCMTEDGGCYINKTEEIDEDGPIANYINSVTLQDDVVDLNNKVVVAYNNMLAEDSDLAKYILDMYAEIEANVGETIARAEGSETASGGTEQEVPEATEAEEEETVTVVTRVKATAVVNIRTSDSETADRLGKAAVGDEFELLEARGNGWSKVSYEGREAFIKSDYLEPVETMEVAQTETGASNTQTDTSSNQNTSANQNTSTGQTTSADQAADTVTVTENVRIRASASENGEKLGTAYVGEKLELVMKQADGWTKIKYNGRIAYVKSDYVE